MPAKSLKTLPLVKGGYPFLGNVFDIDPNTIHKSLEDWSEEYGSVYRLKVLGKDIVVVNDAKLLPHILQNRLTPYNRPENFVNALKGLKIDGLFTNIESDWLSQRQLLVEGMNITRLRGVYEQFEGVTDQLIADWKSKAQEGGATIPVNADIKRYAFDMLCNVSLKYESNSIGSDDLHLFNAIDLIFEALNKRAQQPLPFWKVFKTKFDREVDQAVSRMVDYIHSVIEQNRKQLISTESGYTTNIVQAILQENQNEDCQFSEEKLVGNIFLFMSAGLHTVGNTIMWMIYHMASHQEVQQKLIEEVDAYIKKNGKPASFRNLESLTYHQAFIKESMRLRPSAPIIFIKTSEDVMLDDIEIPKGTDIYGLTGGLGRSSRAFDEPWEFNPERWLPGYKGKHTMKAYMPFSHGPTFCPGRNLAIFECQMFLFTLCQHFTVSLNEEKTQDIKETYHIGLEPSDIFIDIRKR